ncbi:LacI family transcriptional regulator [Ktedonosporobacter rubrisoli]|uniref:LacI family transcriptional regulator n=1 Tax=Ktedonosporobacter rubrisoli TaxID=2509675 RepID=A0A4P6JJK4_KTERU|nr:LacI family DNA-binding transcriptional regulator [Ktedonosporobacter rubrisoli]QBD75112.1 LacI family transcriptional regulator [Ktedonosporobacter rubrisoli]
MTVHLKDIAAYTGVSIKTVSNVVNGNYEHVGPKTRTLVLEAIKKLNYKPNVAARHLRKAPVGVLAYAFPDLANPYFAEVGEAIVAVANQQGYTVLLDFTSAQRDKELNVLTGLQPHLLDGVILDSHALDLEDIVLNDTQRPIVLLGERLFGASVDHILIDNVAASYTATKHLLSLGKRRIAAIGVQQCRSEAPSLRLQGFIQALTEEGLAVDEALLLEGGLWHRADGAAAMRRLLSLDEPPDAVCCFNDLMALGALSVLNESSYRVPGDIAIIGIDDIEDGRYANPALSTIAPDKHEIARLAVTLLVERIKGTRNGPPECIKAPFRLCPRASTLG